MGLRGYRTYPDAAKGAKSRHIVLLESGQVFPTPCSQHRRGYIQGKDFSIRSHRIKMLPNPHQPDFLKPCNFSVFLVSVKRTGKRPQTLKFSKSFGTDTECMCLEGVRRGALQKVSFRFGVFLGCSACGRPVRGLTSLVLWASCHPSPKFFFCRGPRVSSMEAPYKHSLLTDLGFL